MIGRERFQSLISSHANFVPDPVTSLQQSEDAQTLLVGSLDSTVRLIDKSNGGLLSDYKGHHNQTYRISSLFGHSQRTILSGSEDGRILAWDLANGNVLQDIKAHSDRVVSSLTFHPKLPQMVSCGVDGNIIIWTA